MLKCRCFQIARRRSGTRPRGPALRPRGPARLPPGHRLCGSQRPPSDCAGGGRVTSQPGSQKLQGRRKVTEEFDQRRDTRLLPSGPWRDGGHLGATGGTSLWGPISAPRRRHFLRVPCGTRLEKCRFTFLRAPCESICSHTHRPVSPGRLRASLCHRGETSRPPVCVGAAAQGALHRGAVSQRLLCKPPTRPQRPGFVPPSKGQVRGPGRTCVPTCRPAAAYGHSCPPISAPASVPDRPVWCLHS